MKDRELDRILREYVQSKAGDAEKDLRKLVAEPQKEREGRAVTERYIAKKTMPYKWAVGIMSAMCVLVMVFAIVFPIAYVSANIPVPLPGDETESPSFSKVWTADVAFQAAVIGGYEGTYEDFLKLFSNIDTVSVDDEGNITLKLADGSTISAGKVEGSFNKSIVSISVDPSGDLIIAYSDGTMQTLESSIFKGEQGVGIADMYIDEEGYMIVILTDGSIINAGLVNAKETYTLTIDANGGYIDVDGNGRVEFVDSVKEYESGTYVSLPILSKKMYTFEGWYMVVDGREINVGSGVNVVADMTVIAKWSGGPDYPDYTIPEEYHGVYISQSDPNVTLEVESDKIKCTIDGASDYYYPTIIDGKVKMYMDNYYIDMLVDVSFGEGAMVTTFGEQVSVFVKVN